jgi:hypothetical protein
MAYLKNLSVNKISFVNKAANKRKFVLLKSDETPDNNMGDVIRMRKEIKAKLIEVMKSETAIEKIVVLLKADADLKVTEAEVLEVTDFVEVANAATCSAAEAAAAKLEVDKKKKTEETEKAEKAADNTKKEDKDKEPNMPDTEKSELLKANQDLMTRLSKMENDQKKRDLVSWLQKECAFLPEDVNKAADTIMQLEAVSKEAAEKFKETLQKSSTAIQNSKLFSEVGVSTDSLMKSEGDGFELIRKVSRSFDELKKSDKPMTPDAVRHIVNGFGNEYESYRRSHIQRAKTQ